MVRQGSGKIIAPSICFICLQVGCSIDHSVGCKLVEDENVLTLDKNNPKVKTVLSVFLIYAKFSRHIGSAKRIN